MLNPITHLQSRNDAGIVSQLGTNSPCGTQPVYASAFMRNAENGLYTPGVLRGFVAQYNGMSISPAGGSEINECLAENQAGASDIFGCAAADTTSLTLIAPVDAGEEITYAIVAYRDIALTSNQVDSVGVIQYAAVAGVEANIGKSQPPSAQAIIDGTTGQSSTFCSVVTLVIVPYGTTSLSNGMIHTHMATNTLLPSPKVVHQYSGTVLCHTPTGHGVVMQPGQENFWTPVSLTLDVAAPLTFTMTCDGMRAFNNTAGFFQFVIDNQCVGIAYRFHLGSIDQYIKAPPTIYLSPHYTDRIMVPAGVHEISCHLTNDPLSSGPYVIEALYLQVWDV